VHKYPDWEPSKRLLEVARSIDRKLQAKGKLSQL